ncbi:MAG TPA: DUF1464 family protein [Methylomirabilota bacterium]|jgi:predicted butyrate kinase (DUF1464 family)
MPRVIGVDPGTESFDLCGLADGHVFLEASIGAEDARRAPAALVDRLEAARPLDLIAAPSGYGLPLVPVAALDQRQLDLVVLVRPEDRDQPERVGGLRAMVELMRARRLPAMLLPGVVHLDTVPAHRKVNRVDMGTADKLCVAALGIWDQGRRLGLPPEGTAFVLLELGGFFTAALAVEHGRIVDGIGGSAGGLGYRALGTLDGEVAYALGRVRKSTLFTGGAAFVSGAPDLAPEELAARAAHDPRARTGWDALIEAAAKLVAALRVAAPGAREVLLSGRVGRVPAVAEALGQRLAGALPVRPIGGFATRVKEAAQGAALIADGLAGGAHRNVVDAMRLSASRGSVLDHLHLAGADEVRSRFGLACGS